MCASICTIPRNYICVPIFTRIISPFFTDSLLGLILPFITSLSALFPFMISLEEYMLVANRATSV